MLVNLLWGVVQSCASGSEARHRNSVLGSEADLQFLGQLNTQVPRKKEGIFTAAGEFETTNITFFFTKPNTEFGQRKWGFCPKKIRIWRMKMVMWCARQQGGGKQQKREIHSVSTRHGDLYDQQEWGLIVIDDLCPTWLVDARQKNCGELNHFNEPNWLRKSNKCGLF